MILYPYLIIDLLYISYKLIYIIIIDFPNSSKPFTIPKMSTNKKEIHTYKAPWQIYGLAWSNRQSETNKVSGRWLEVILGIEGAELQTLSQLLFFIICDIFVLIYMNSSNHLDNNHQDDINVIKVKKDI